MIAADYCAPDPIRVGDDYYMVASTFESFPGVSILHSKDLVNWTAIGSALTDLAIIDSAYTAKKMQRYNGGVYAPTISYHNGKFYIYVNLYTDGFYVATAENPKGPWTSGFVKDKEGQMAWRLPKPIQGYAPVLPQGSDDFGKPTLHSQWMWNHVPDSSKWSLTERPGYLRLYASPTNGKGFFKAPNTLSQRYMRSDSAVVTIRLEIAGMRNGQKAGLAHFNGGKNYAFLAVAKQDDAFRMEFETDGRNTAGIVLPPGQSDLFLRTSMGVADKAVFEYSFDGITYHEWGGPYPMKAANFRGDMMGVFTYNDSGRGGRVDVDWFHYRVSNR